MRQKEEGKRDTKREKYKNGRAGRSRKKKQGRKEGGRGGEERAGRREGEGRERRENLYSWF